MITKEEKELDEKIKKENKSIVQISSRANKVAIIKSNEDLIKAVEFLVQVKNKLKNYEEERLSYTEPINKTLKRLNDRFKILTEPLKLAQRGVKDAVLTYRKKKEEKRQIEEKKIRKKNGNENIILPEIVPDIVESKSGEIRTRKNWVFKIVDEKKVPREYMIIDEKKVREAIREGKRKIKGLEIYQEEDLSTY